MTGRAKLANLAIRTLSQRGLLWSVMTAEDEDGEMCLVFESAEDLEELGRVRVKAYCDLNRGHARPCETLPPT